MTKKLKLTEKDEKARAKRKKLADQYLRLWYAFHSLNKGNPKARQLDKLSAEVLKQWIELYEEDELCEKERKDPSGWSALNRHPQAPSMFRM